MRLDHLLSKEHRPPTLFGRVGVYAVFVSERLTPGTLISGALATRISMIADRLVPPGVSLRRRAGSGNDGFRG
ncbi:hypothetical protein GCM10022252_79950 [Streptosporangium oxazolinicum]|uniref:Uncharacterized protein n=1 Tax=Streptosporangium oxazolinicum TaxID=909287 RepID=A0ABP8BNQ3_9ACTN